MAPSIKKVWNVCTSVLVAVIVLIAVLLVGVRVIGLTPYVVLSGSMEPVYPVGSLVYVKNVEPETVEVGDPITFVLDEELTVVTHRVVAIDAESEQFTTKGDANDVIDGAPVHFNNLIGRPVFCIPKLGYLSNFLTQPPGRYVGWSIIAVAVILLFAPEILKWADDADKKAAQKRRRNH